MLRNTKLLPIASCSPEFEMSCGRQTPHCAVDSKLFLAFDPHTIAVRVNSVRPTKPHATSFRQAIPASTRSRLLHMSYRDQTRRFEDSSSKAIQSQN